jgi:restriction system protein
MNSLEAAETILSQAGEPLHYQEITRRILAQKLWATQGKTPDATINAQLVVEINERGVGSHFQRTGPGIYALRSWSLPEFTGKTRPAGSRKSTVQPASETPQLTSALTFNDAAEVVLEKHSNQQPMHYRDITEKILKLGLVHTEGQTPEATLYAQILTEIKRQLKRGESPRFVRHGKGYIGLRKWMGEGLAYEIQNHNAEVRKKLHQRLFKISPAEFEALVAQLLVALGFEDVFVTQISNDGGIDVRGTLVVGEVIRTKMAIQVKRWKKNVQSPIVQQVRGSLSAHEQGLIITTSDFSKGASEEAQMSDKTPVALMNGEQFVALLVENDIGIQRTAYDLIDLEED